MIRPLPDYLLVVLWDYYTELPVEDNTPDQPSYVAAPDRVRSFRAWLDYLSREDEDRDDLMDDADHKFLAEYKAQERSEQRGPTTPKT